MTNKYSVLMSVYQGEKPEFFKSSIKSMLEQTIKPDQIVIVKDGKLTPHLESIVKKYVSYHPDTFTIVPLKENVGLGLALNEGLKRCRNELVARMDTDDISLSNRCELQLNEFNNNEDLSIVGTMIDEFDDNPQHIISSRVVPENHESILKFSKRRNPFNHPSVMYKKSTVLQCGGYGNYRRNQDFDLFVRMLNSGFIAKNIGKSLILFRANRDNSKRRKSWVKCKSNIQLMFKFWKKGYSSFFDFIFVSSVQLIVFLSPSWFFDWLSNTFLRKDPLEHES